MNDFFNTDDRSNRTVFGKTAEGSHDVVQQRALDLLRVNRKVNSGTPVQAKPAAPWYRRFAKR